jgi:hypothetical protein
MNARHRKTLAAIMADPLPKSLPFRDVESLLRAIGCDVIEGGESRVTFSWNGRKWHTHRPHPEKETWPYQLRSLRPYLEKIVTKP